MFDKIEKKTEFGEHAFLLVFPVLAKDIESLKWAFARTELHSNFFTGGGL